MVTMTECYKIPCIIVNPKQRRCDVCEEFSATCNCSSFVIGRRRSNSSACGPSGKESQNLIVEESSDDSSSWKPRIWVDSNSNMFRKSEVQLCERKYESSIDMPLDERCWIQPESDRVSKECPLGKEDRREDHRSFIDLLGCLRASKSVPRPTFKGEMLMMAKKIHGTTRDRKWQDSQSRSRSAKSGLQLPRTARKSANHVCQKGERSNRIKEAEEEARKNAKHKLAMLRLQLKGEIHAVYITQKLTARRMGIVEQELQNNDRKIAYLRKLNRDSSDEGYGDAIAPKEFPKSIDVPYPESLKLLLEDVLQNSANSKLEVEKFDPFDEGTDSDFYEVKVTAISNRLSQHRLALELMADHLEGYNTPESELFTIADEKRVSFSNKSGHQLQTQFRGLVEHENGRNEKVEPKRREFLQPPPLATRQANDTPAFVDTFLKIRMVEEESGKLGFEEVSLSRYVFY